MTGKSQTFMALNQHVTTQKEYIRAKYAKIAC